VRLYVLYVLFSNMTATSFVAIALIVLLLPSPLPPPPSFPFPTDTNEDHLAFASSSISGSQTTVTLPAPPPSSSPSAPSSTLDNESTQLSQAQIGKGPGPSSDNFNLPTGYIMEPFLENLSMPTSIAIDSKNGTIYVAESVNEYDNDNSSILTSSLSSHSFLSQQPQVRIVKAEISNDTDMTVNQTLNHSGDGISNNDNSSNIINTALNWPVIDMEVDDTTGLLYALHDLTTISRINTTSGEREDILAREEVEQTAAAAGSDKYEEEQQDPLSFLINSSSQIVLSRNEDHYDTQYDIGGVGGGGSNPDSYNFTTMLYVPCMNDDANNSNYGTYCILGLPIDRNDNSAIVDNFGSINPSSSSILENMTSRPVGIAILNSSSHASSSSSPYSSLPSRSSLSEQQRPYAPTGSQTSNAFFNNSENDLLIITSQLPSNSSIFSNTNNDNYNEQNHISYGISSNNYSSDGAALSSLNTIYHAKVFDSMPYPGNSSNNLQDTIINNNDYSDSSNYNHRQQAPPPSMEVLADYPYGRLGQVAVVSVPSISVPPTTVTISSSSSSSSANETTQTNQTPSIEDYNLSASYPLPFGLNETTAFIADFGNSSASGAALNLPKIIMLDVQTGNIAPFLAPKQSDPSFIPIDIAFDYNSNALYVLSTGNNQEGDASNNLTNNNNNNLLNTGSLNNNSSGIIWRISYQGEEQEAATSSNSSSIDNVTDNDDSDINNVTSSLTTPQPSSSSNDTDSSDNSTDSGSNDSNGLDESSSYDEDEDNTDDGSSGTDNGGSGSSSEEDTEDNSGSSESSSSGDSSQQSPPSTEPVNTAPIAEDDAATTDQDTPIVIDVLANDMDEDEDDSLTIDSVDEQSVQGGNVRIISSGSGDDDSDNDNDNNDSGGNTNEKIEYVPAEGFSGTDEFTYTIVDTNGAIGSATVTVTVNEVVLAPHPISYWLENEDGITEDLLEKAAEHHENNNNDDKWSFNLGNFRVPVKFDISDSKNDTKGILEVAEGNGNNNDNDDDNKTNAYDQLAAQLLAAKLNIENGVLTCESIETTIENADNVLVNADYVGPGTTETPAGKSRDYASELIEVLDKYNINGCV
jgi:hypothetical protein